MNTDLLIEYISSFRRNRSRFLLEGFAVASGICVLLIVITGLNVFKHGSLGQYGNTDLETVALKTNPTTKFYCGFGSGRIWNLENSDVDVIKKEFKNTIIDAGPIYMFAENLYAQRENGKRDHAKTIAIHPGIFKIIASSMVYGRFINELDMQQKRKVCIIGMTLSEQWYGKGTDPCGKSILLNGALFQIVGVLRKDNGMVIPFGDESNAILLPYPTADDVFNLNGALSKLVFSLKASDGYEQRTNDVIQCIKRRHQINPEDNYAIYATSILDYIQMLNTIFNGIEIFCWVVFTGLIFSSLLGVFGITLLSVRERKNEIGLRLTMGAEPTDIEKQFVFESVIIVLISSISGLIVSEILLAILRTLHKQDIITNPIFGIPTLSFAGVLTVIFLILAAGIASGYFPARNMIKKQITELFDDLI